MKVTDVNFVKSKGPELVDDMLQLIARRAADKLSAEVDEDTAKVVKELSVNITREVLDRLTNIKYEKDMVSNTMRVYLMVKLTEGDLVCMGKG